LFHPDGKAMNRVDLKLLLKLLRCASLSTAPEQRASSMNALSLVSDFVLENNKGK
jgi:hypothetical protein